MANPNNLIRPPILNAPVQNPPIPPSSPNQPGRNEQGQMTLADLRTVILQVINSQLPEMLQASLNPNAIQGNAVDQAIDVEHLGNLGDLDKIPDVVKCLREFSGKAGEFNSWRKSVERILKIYENLRGTPKYYGILNIIRNKIVGNADIALESYNTPLDWAAISKCLTLHYADKRDVSTLEYQMTGLIQGNSTVQEFYQNVYSHLSLILNKLGGLEAGNEALNLLTQTYRGKALDTFIRGLNGDLPRLLGMREPADLPQALHLCLKLENQKFRTNHAQNYNNQPARKDYQPPSTPKYNLQSNRQPFHPSIAYIPYQQNLPTMKPNNKIGDQSSNYPRHPPPRPTAPKPAEPMDVDRSIRSQQINYANRPPQQQFLGKRPPNPPSKQNINPAKAQRTFHINTEMTDTLEHDNVNYESHDQDQELTEYYDQELENFYYDTYQAEEDDRAVNEVGAELSDIHFLE